LTAPGPIAEGYESFYAAWGRSPALRRIWREHVTGPDYPEVFAHISFLSFADLRSLGAALSVGDDELLVDVACGAGGPGLWVAQESGARVIGIDQSVQAIERARERVVPVGLDGRAEFLPGTFARTGLRAASVDAVMTVDALQYAPDKADAVSEVARILRPGRRFAFVAFELDVARVAGLGLWDDPVGDYRPLLSAAGFTVVSYEELPGWSDQVGAGFGAVLEQRELLEAELGTEAAAALVLEASVTLEVRPYSGHVLAVAEAPGRVAGNS
jgi:SAM-dependent methyltransferase